MTEWKECKLGDASFDIIDGDRGKTTLKRMSFLKAVIVFF